MLTGVPALSGSVYQLTYSPAIQAQMEAQPGRGTQPMRRAGRAVDLVAEHFIDFFDGIAPSYDDWCNGLHRKVAKRLAEFVEPRPGQHALDVGCGTGLVTRHVADAIAPTGTVVGVDISEGMLAEARRKPAAAAVCFVVHDLHRPLPFASGAFDLVVSGLVLEHLRELDGFFAEARRVLRPGGRAVVSGMHPAMCLRGAQARFTDPATGEVVQPGSLPHSVGAFVMAAVRAGFRLSDVAEFAPDARFAERYPRAGKYVGWPMLVVLSLAG
jgi:malonyl-CoA O-methyltransferase